MSQPTVAASVQQLLEGLSGSCRIDGGGLVV